MATPVVMPQMGESIAEGTIVRWMKKVGDQVDRDEPLFEITTDKVDAEIPAPAAGVLTEIKVKEGETVAVNSVVATIGDASEVSVAVVQAATAVVPAATAVVPAAASRQPPGKSAAPAATATAGAAPAASPTADVQTQADGSGPTQKKGGTAQKPNGREAAAAPTQDDVRRQKSSPLVRRIAKEHNVDVSQLQGSGLGGRVTKHD